MKSILLAASFGCLLVAIVTAIFRLQRPERRAAVMTRIFLVLLPLLIVAHLAMPPDLGFLPDAMTQTVLWIDLAFTIFLYAAGFFGGVLQVYNLADRGFSLRILIDALEQGGEISLSKVMTGYSAGKGISWMYDKRIQGMESNGLIVIEDGVIHLSEKGVRFTRLFSWLHRFTRQETMIPGGPI